MPRFIGSIAVFCACCGGGRPREGRTTNDERRRTQEMGSSTSQDVKNIPPNHRKVASPSISPGFNNQAMSQDHVKASSSPSPTSIPTTKFPSGINLMMSQALKNTPSTRLCFYCCDDGRELPLELFMKLPCCNGATMCIHCFRKRCYKQKLGESSEGLHCCGECLTTSPDGNDMACLWLRSLIIQRPHDNVHVRFLLGQMLNFDWHARVDEVLGRPYYYSWRPPLCTWEEVIFRPDRNAAVMLLKALADDHYYLPAILALADIYAMHYFNKTMAEHYYQKGVARETSLFPMGATRYGLFLLSEGRTCKAMEFLGLAAECGHVVGQYEYAQCLLQSFRTEARSWSYRMLWGDEKKCQSLMEAIQYLCKASEKGFYPKANVLLARTLIETAEAMDPKGRADSVGSSPLPRAMQLLRLAGEDRDWSKIVPFLVGEGAKLDEQIKRLRLSYQHVDTHCANCGDVATEFSPLIPCPDCRVVHYCSKICRKEDFRNGHRFDCCTLDTLFRFDIIEKTLLAPIIRARSQQQQQQHIPNDTLDCVLPTSDPDEPSNKRSLPDLVEAFTDELNGGEDGNYSEERLGRLMLTMRKNLESYLMKRPFVTLGNSSGNKRNPPNLAQLIRQMQDSEPVTPEFAQAMHEIRMLGNVAAHNPNEGDDTAGAGCKLDQTKCDSVVRSFLELKNKHDGLFPRGRLLPNKEIDVALPDADHTTASAEEANATADTLEHDGLFPREPLSLEEGIQELLRSPNVDGDIVAFVDADHTTASAEEANATADTLEHDGLFPREPLSLEEEIQELLRSPNVDGAIVAFVDADHTTASVGEANATKDNILED